MSQAGACELAMDGFMLGRARLARRGIQRCMLEPVRRRKKKEKRAESGSELL
jgi:hypothetical protein